MQELIFIIILAVFIGGMLWSDRDSRCEKSWCYDCGAVSWTERYEPIIKIGVRTTPTRFTQSMIDVFAENLKTENILLNSFFGNKLDDDFSCAAMFNIDIAKDEKIKLPDVTFTERTNHESKN